MRFYERNYDKAPKIAIEGFEKAAFKGAGMISGELACLAFEPMVVVDCYPGVSDEALALVREALRPDVVVESRGIYRDTAELDLMLAPHVTADRVRGTMFYGRLEDLVDPVLLEKTRDLVHEARERGKRVLVYGFGAALIEADAPLIYCDLARWEIQLRYRTGMPNYFWDNPDEDPLCKIKRGFFIEWRIADKHKIELMERIDYLLDTCRAGDPRMVSGEAFRAGLAEVVHRPFRLVPYFDPGVWGGQWMKDVCGLDPKEPNYAWSFDGVPEENSIYLDYGSTVIEVPAQDVVLTHPVELLGRKNFCRFGAEFPIRFDFLDTMDGQNLSLQVHPLTEYIKSHFGMTYTQDESYYILDAGEGGGVFLGLKEGIDSAEMMSELRAAQRGERDFPVERFVNFFPAKRHDHFLIPAGTVHCSSANCMVLEISATPYIFTFKLWDWGRLGLDGLPRPIHIDDGERNIQWDRATGWVKDNLVNRIELLHEEPGAREEKTGLHELEFIETRRFWSTRAIEHDASAGVHMLNLVDGPAAIVESPEGKFEPFTVHYAETFIVPAGAGRYAIRPLEEGQEIVYVQASVRNV